MTSHVARDYLALPIQFGRGGIIHGSGVPRNRVKLNNSFAVYTEKVPLENSTIIDPCISFAFRIVIIAPS